MSATLYLSEDMRLGSLLKRFCSGAICVDFDVEESSHMRAVLWNHLYLEIRLKIRSSIVGQANHSVDDTSDV